MPVSVILQFNPPFSNFQVKRIIFCLLSHAAFSAAGGEEDLWFCAVKLGIQLAVRQIKFREYFVPDSF
jgi:hypothetical protein